MNMGNLYLKKNQTIKTKKHGKNVEVRRLKKNENGKTKEKKKKSYVNPHLHQFVNFI